MNAAQSQAPVFSIPVENARDFACNNLLIDDFPLSLAQTRDKSVMAKLTEQASLFFVDMIPEIKRQLDNPFVGIVAIDVPQVFDDATVDAIVGSLIAVSLTQAIMPSLPDRENNAPFSIFTASKDNSKNLDHVGIRGLSPTVYDNGQSSVKIVDRRARAAIFTRAPDGSITTFMNGTFEGHADTGTDQAKDITAEIKSTIAANPVRYSIPQESRRLIILNNANGFHARDIFENPMEGYAVTRTYLRSASISGKVVGRIIEG